MWNLAYNRQAILLEKCMSSYPADNFQNNGKVGE